MNIKVSKNLYFIYLLLTICIFTISVSAKSKKISGYVVDTNQNPIVGVSVVVVAGTQVVSGSTTDSSGLFELDIYTTKYFEIKFAAIGYEDKILLFDSLLERTVLIEKPVVVSSIAVTDNQIQSSDKLHFSGDLYKQRVSNSIVTNNPIDAVVSPQIAKQGSSFSSKLRINGSTPDIYFHNSSIGSNPNHYGMFSVIPASLVENVIFYPQGTPASYQKVSILDLKPFKLFNKQNIKSIDFSAVQSTGTFGTSRDKYYLLASVRKSVLDKLVKYINLKSDRRTIPPTNFEDVAVTSGLQIDTRSTFFIDQLYTRDYLAYDTEPTKSNQYGLYTFQHAKTYFTGLTYQISEENSLVEFKVTRRYKKEEYEVLPRKYNPTGLHLALNEKSTEYTSRLDFTNYLKHAEIQSGVELKYEHERETSLNQTNWNFRSPDATSNNPFVYQSEINMLYGKEFYRSSNLYTAFYSQTTLRKKHFDYSFGLRYETYDKIQKNKKMTYRSNVIYKISQQQNLSFYTGSFSESPVENILEDYQVLVRHYFASLEPVMTNLYKLSYQNRNLSISAFHKRIDNRAVPTIHYEYIDSDNLILSKFIQMESIGSLRFNGFDITLEQKNLFGSNMSMYTYYAFTDAVKMSNTYQSAYELNAPHRFMLELNYNASKRLSYGSKLSYHSGYAYTPYIVDANINSDEKYNNAYLNEYRESENSAYFPFYLSLDLFVHLKFKNSSLNFSISNLTNRKNPVVLTNEGYIYDPGILPSIGFSWNL